MTRAKKKVDEFVSYFKEKHLGLKRKTVSLVSHKKEWAEAFIWLSSKLEEKLSLEDFHHIGSTSVKELTAKPILDVLVVFESKEKQKEAISFFESLGFVHKGDMVGQITDEVLDQTRHFYSYYDLEEKIDYAHLHSYVEGHPDIKKLLDFRNKLRKSKEARKDYENIKRDLYQSGKARRDYTKLKKNFVERQLD